MIVRGRLGMKFRVPLTTFGPSVVWDVMSLVPPCSGAFLGLVPYHVGLSDAELTQHSVGRSVIIWLAVSTTRPPSRVSVLDC